MLTIGACRRDDAQAVTVDAADQSQVTARLAKWDGLDGEKDKTIAKCAGCALSMDGKSDHALMVSGYSLHFCSAACKKHFASDAVKKILALKPPED